ncbi:MAG: hypothetical protein JWN44_849 [Myxococcales bacterium]|nr:hypothetical protein [Myxococcales bacterium]
MISRGTALATSLLWGRAMERTSFKVLWLGALLTAGCLPAAMLGPDPGGDPAIANECGTSYSPGHVSIHRLTNDEYSNTVRDLLFTTTRPGDALPPTTAGFSGFTNDSDHLNVYEDLVIGYYDAAEALAKEVLASKAQPDGAYGRIVRCAPSSACAESTVADLGRRAFRRPLATDEKAALMSVFAASGDFDTGLSDVIISLLVSPKFLFNYVSGPDAQTDAAAFRIDNYALASRLSYFLWQSMPDDALFARADDGTLNQPDTLKAEVVRMLKDGKSAAFETVLRNEWAGLASLASPAATRPGLDDAVRMSMVGEVDAFLGDIIHNDRSFMNVLTGNYSFVNQTLADYYDMPFTGADAAQFVRADSSPNHRRGIVTTAAVLTATAGDVLYTHPVKRGKWVTARILCSEPPPPPPDIPVIDFNTGAGGGTPREKLSAHANAPACIGCHKTMDVVGLGLENFDSFGNWRQLYDGSVPIDATGTLPDGRSFTDPFQMYQQIASGDEAKACLTQQIMSYALTRAMSSHDDKCVTHAIGNLSLGPEATFSDLIVKIVSTNQFQMQTGEAP